MYLRYGTEHTLLTEAEIDEEFGKQDIARIFVRRDLIDESDVERGETEMWIVEDDSVPESDAEFGGVLRDINRQGTLTELIVESFERYSRDALPTSGGERWDGAPDTDVVEHAVDQVDLLTRGVIQTVKSPITMVFSHASQAKKIRETQSATGAEVTYHPDKSVDYVEQKGEDKTATVLSPSNQNITGDFNADKKSGEEDITHLRLIGAGEGRHQIAVNLVPDTDPFDYEGSDDFDNVTRYNASHWEEGDRREWAVKSNKDHTDSSSLTLLGETIMDDVQTTHVEAFATVEGVEVNLGDLFTVVYDEEDINEEMRVVKLTTFIDKTGFTYEADLSTRRESLEDAESEDRKDTDRYNMSFEGSPVTINTGGGRQPVTAAVPYEFSFYYPDEVQHEHRVKLTVKGDAYRAYSRGAEAGGEHTHSFEYIATGEHGHSITSSEFAHHHVLKPENVSAENHGHDSGSYDADSHGHLSGTYGADSHGHFAGTYGADSHGHGAGTYGADSHGHDSGTYDADSHEHGVNIGDTSDPDVSTGDYTRDEINLEDGSTLTTTVNLGDNGDSNIDVWIQGEVGFIDDEPAGVIMEVHNGTATDDLIDDVGTNISQGQSFSVGMVAGHKERSSSYVTIEVRAFDQFLNDVQMENVDGLVQAIPDHTHDVFVSGESGFTGPAVFGDSGAHAPNVDGNSDDTSPNVSGSSDDTSPDVSGSSSDTSPGVTGTSSGENPGVDGQSEEEGGVRTTTSEEEVVESETTPPDQGGHEHEPEPGVIRFGQETPENVDVVVNGSTVATNIGSGSFQTQVDLRGDLQPGQINTIQLESETLGHIQAHVDIDVYRQILGDG